MVSKINARYEERRGALAMRESVSKCPYRANCHTLLVCDGFRQLRMLLTCSCTQISYCTSLRRGGNVPADNPEMQ